MRMWSFERERVEILGWRVSKGSAEDVAGEGNSRLCPISLVPVLPPTCSCQFNQINHAEFTPRRLAMGVVQSFVLWGPSLIDRVRRTCPRKSKRRGVSTF